MYELVTSAIVLARYPRSEQDLRVTLFCRDLGKIHATVVSGRALTSKLSPHLMEGSVVAVRVIEQHDMRVVDALTVKSDVLGLEECIFLDRLLPEHVVESLVWRLVTSANISWRSVLARLGWDPEHAACHECGKSVAGFIIRSQEFVCAAHMSALPLGPGEVVPCTV